MQTISIIGSNKNAGKTTVLNYIATTKLNNAQNICITSIGINGENIDSLSSKPKPQIKLSINTYFITEITHLLSSHGRYQILDVLAPPIFQKTYVIAKATSSLQVLIEGPNTKNSLIFMKDRLKSIIQDGILFIDGSINRLITAHPEISNSIILCLLLKNTPTQVSYINTFLRPFLLPLYKGKFDKQLHSNPILYNAETEIHLSIEKINSHISINFIKKECQKYSDTIIEIHLNEPVLNNFIQILNFIPNLHIILNNITLLPILKLDSNKVFIKRSSEIIGIYKNELTSSYHGHLPLNIPTQNIYRNSTNEINFTLN
ncbi:hypothetical protein OAB57_00905 [Bacteriovoracaceae bacterium]|nr:hypothetical protein [Bacteriovoracaceae bacterium]